jgi:hypothetical protein
VINPRKLTCRVFGLTQMWNRSEWWTGELDGLLLSLGLVVIC